MEKNHAPLRPDLLFEVSWEVCNKIGGIYTVLSTKARTLQNLSKDTTIFIGPDVWTPESPSPWFIETPVKGLSEWAASAKLPGGIKARVGRWDIPGQPIAVLITFDGLYASKDAFYGEMWQRFGVDSLHAYGDYDEGCAFGRAAGIVIGSIIASGFGTIPARGRRKAKAPENVVAHFDEWTTGMGLLYVKAYLPEVATVFTTHATSIGRSICGNNKPLYDYMAGYNGCQMARELNMEAKHSLERAAAHNADAFTTVSDVTARECEQLLERRPDVVTPNGFEKDFVPAGKALDQARAKARARMLEVASALTGVSYSDDAFIVITSGRCEYRNKGLDVFIDMAARLRENAPARPVLAFIMVPAWVREPRADLSARLAAGEKASTPLPDPVLTHALNNNDSDPVACRLRQTGFASVDPRVTVIYVPCYLNGTDGIFNLPYYDILPGADATVFASYYEPWGYTPLESVAFGVPTVTTSLSGFGQWVLSNFDNYFDACGVNVIGRGDSNYHDVVTHLASSVEYLAGCGPKETAAIRSAAMHTADAAAWEGFIDFYTEAYDIALRKVAEK